MVGDIYEPVIETSFPFLAVQIRNYLIRKYIYSILVATDANFPLEYCDLPLPSTGWSDLKKEYILVNGITMLLWRRDPKVKLKKIGEVSHRYLHFFDILQYSPTIPHARGGLRLELSNAIFDFEMEGR